MMRPAIRREAGGLSAMRTAKAAAAALMIVAATVMTLLTTRAGGQDARTLSTAAVFSVVDVYVDSDQPLAAWQFELEEAAGQMQVVGIEGGDALPYAEPPYYDREAVDGGTADRIIVAAFSTEPSATLPVGRTRVASVHVRLAGGTPPDYRLSLTAAGAPDGRSIDAGITFDTRSGR